jgi:starch phosphorylase
MQSIGTISVQPVLPDAIQDLERLSKNIWWSWTPRAAELFEAINPRVWEVSNHNPVRVLRECDQADLERVAADQDYRLRVRGVMQAFEAYLARKDTWFKAHQPNFNGHVAYFCMEYGFHESIQIYSGGLGILAGDHCKSASDLGVPFTAIGLYYREGYFHQQLDSSGWQGETFENLVPENLPLTLVTDSSGAPLKISVEVGARNITVQAWRLEVGRIHVYLLDSFVPENSDADKYTTAQLYDSGRRRGVDAQELRVAQELILGVGGMRLLRALEIPATVFHMNEGHAAFLGLERLRELILDSKLSFNAALEVVAGSSVFTTHTPVPAGNDAFPQALADKQLSTYWPGALGVSRQELLDLALVQQPWGPTFSMPVLALRLSRFANGVSELHGQVSRGMWGFLWGGADAPEVPITHVTNGIHTRTFLAPSLAKLFDTAFKAGWDDRLHEAQTWQLERVDDDDLWNARLELKKKLIAFTRERLHRQNRRNNTLTGSEHVLEPEVLTIGFARRFATYKRATMLFKDLERLKKIVGGSRPVQFIFAGKAHPADNPGKEFIQALYRFSQDPDLKGKVVFLEDYDMNVAKHLVQGCDIWLNNPRRPLEASGTSGEKASLNGCINFSVLDGWWREAWDGSNGWAIGDETAYGSDDASLKLQDDNDAQSLYDVLEFDIAPRYYDDRAAWLETVRRAIVTVAPKFSMQRQVIDYVQQLYAPAEARGDVMRASQFARAQTLAAWKDTVRQRWNDVRLEATLDNQASAPGGKVHISARVYLGDEAPEHIQVQAVLERPDSHGQPAAWHTPLTLQKTNDDGWLEYAGTVVVPEAGDFNVGVRVLPYHSDLAQPLELGLMRWA